MSNLKVCVLSSGSKGNSVYVETQENKILIDAGVTTAYLERKLKEINVEAKEINAIFITHTHSDHVAGLKTFLKKYEPTLYLTKKMYDELKLDMNISNYELINDDFELRDTKIKVIKTSHDTSDSNGYIFEYNDKSVAYITDTGYINVKNHNRLKNRSVYIMESNHDINMLMSGNYPYYLKQRILGDSGHLSNEDSAYYLSQFIGDKTKKIFLAHLSDDNNDPEIAINTLKQTLKENNIQFDSIVVAPQKERTEMVEV